MAANGLQLCKVLKIDDVEKELYPTTFGSVELYPNGTKRTIKKLTFRGWKTIHQIAVIESDNNLDSYIYYNRWKKGVKNEKSKAIFKRM